MPDTSLETSSLRFAVLYRMLIDSIPSTVVLIDQQEQITTVNRNFLTKARTTEKDVLGKSIRLVFPPVLYQQMNLAQRVAEVFRLGRPLHGEKVVYRSPGLPMRTYYYSLIPFRWEGKVENVMLLMEDITEQVRLGEEAIQSSRHLASVVESASDMVLSLNPQGQIITWNSAAASITGFEVANILGKHFLDLCEPQSNREKAAALIREAFLQGRTPPVELEMVDKEGKDLMISWVFSAMHNTEEQTTGLVAVGRNLTEQRKLESQLIQADRLSALGVMAGGIAHEIRNPLAVISSAAQLLMGKKLAEDVQEDCIGRIHQNTQRASSIIENLLRFARPAEKDSKQWLDLREIIQDSIDLLDNQLRLDKVKLGCQMPAVPVTIQGNSGLLQQLLTNLFLNSLNSMQGRPGDQILLNLTTNSTHATVEVRDQGKGISQKNLNKVFDPFFTTMPVGKGTGLGLSICYAIVHQHGGKIEMESTEGQGTVVTISLPLNPVKGS